MDQLDEIIQEAEATQPLPHLNTGPTANLFVFPGQCNFSGLQYPLELTEKIKTSRKFREYASLPK